MIIKLDHIAYSCSRKAVDKVIHDFSSYTQCFYQKSLPNLDIKRNLMKLWDNTHDIILLSKEDDIPVEITAYDHVSSSETYSVKEGKIIVYTSSMIQSKTFYEALGFKSCSNDELELRTPMDSKPIIIQIREVEGKERGYLDSAGYSCVAFVTNRAEQERKKLEKVGVLTTEIQALEVNGKNLEIFFAYTEIGDMCEFISINKG